MRSFAPLSGPRPPSGASRPPDLGVVEGPQDLVDKGLVALALGAEPFEDVAVEPQRDDVLAGRNDDVGLIPVDVEGRGVWVVGHGFGDIVVGHRVEAGVVGFAFKTPRLIARHARNTFSVLAHWLSSR